MPQPIPYLSFDGDCAEAMRFYAAVLGGTLGMMNVGQSPMSDQCPSEERERIMHARLALADGSSLYGGDCMGGMAYQGQHGVSLTLNFDSVAEAERVFNALGEGGEVTMPFADTFWAKKFGMVKDRFGTHWIVNGELLELSLS
ncbi:VOC family protein [Sphingomonas quercus]|uniref:VOC family protein n=1 Tax=Sphingomonas quercus TaxID=2842451 RepID=A0ABS6BGW1_9SPHN|nr:VOC family protein [Sphingomonas quercus]MBU3076822.1 VOC family protein [Sphingomonas quercus]